MSILIKGMEMPKNCETCELSSTDSSGFFGCYVTGNIVIRKREQDRPSWCPLIELPPHGRLIDADAWIAKVREELLSPNCKKGALEIMGAMFRDVLDAPTIIESEVEDG